MFIRRSTAGTLPAGSETSIPGVGMTLNGYGTSLPAAATLPPGYLTSSPGAWMAPPDAGIPSTRGGPSS